MVGLWDNTPWAGEPNYSAGPSLAASHDPQCHQASPRSYATLDAPRPLHSRTTGLFGAHFVSAGLQCLSNRNAGSTANVPHSVMHSQNPPSSAGVPEAYSGQDGVLFLDRRLHTP